jgi:beta-galactosidase
MSVSSVKLSRRSLLLGTTGAALALAGATPPAFAAAASKAKLGRSQPFDLGWRFQRGEGEGFEAPGFDDTSWRAVDLPHDWSIEDLPPAPQTSGSPRIVGPFDKKAIGGTATGFSVGGDGWYRKHFRLEAPAGAHVELLFDGVYMNSDVWINGHHLGAHTNGYTPFAYDLTPYLSAKGENVLAVRVQNRGRNSRWYSGSGIYRHVWLDVWTQPARIARWGVGVTTRRVVDATATVEIVTTLEAADQGLMVSSRVLDPKGRVVWEGSAPASATVFQTAELASARLWSPDDPSLYVLETKLKRGSTVLDRTVTSFGVRIVTFSPATGMALNGAPTKLRGGCIHHDNGLIGAAAFDTAEVRKIELLKARGYNAVRASHNPFSPAFLDACDRLGMLVISEAFDAWRDAKEPQDYSVAFEQNWRSDLTAMVLSARNHPSVIMWSIGNEIPKRNLPQGVEAQWFLANEVRKLDPSRPVTAAINEFAGRLVTPSPESLRPGQAPKPDEASVVFLDVVGYNYTRRKYEADHAAFPDRIIYGSESFPKDLFKTWDMTDRSPWLAGDFVWTAMDYLGEAGIGGNVYAKPGDGLASLGFWPWVVSGCGDLDLIGHQKGPSLARDVVWGLSDLEVAVQKPPPEGKIEVLRPWGWSDERQSWTWPEAQGKPLAVRIYTSGDRVTVRLNGETIAQKAVTAADLKHIEIPVVYAPGVLEVVAYREDAEVGRRTLATSSAAVAVRVTPEARKARAGRGELSYVQIELVDAQGRRAPDLTKPLNLSLTGPAELIGFGSANPLAVGSFQATGAKTWDGRALAILRGRGRPGEVRITVSSDGLASGKASLFLT